MAYTDKELAIAEYIKMFGTPDESAGFSLCANYDNYGVWVSRLYQRNSWVDEECDHSVFFIKGEIKELKTAGKQKGKKVTVGTYKEKES